jgi:hypothetical protein
MTAVVLDSTLTCPECGTRAVERMPTDACIFFWICPACAVRITPKPGDCCVFCSYGNVVCPPKQAGEDCCA